MFSINLIIAQSHVVMQVEEAENVVRSQGWATREPAMSILAIVIKLYTFGFTAASFDACEETTPKSIVVIDTLIKCNPIK